MPLMAIGAVQIVLNLVDTWFIGRLSGDALAAMSAAQGMALVIVVLAGGCTHATQILVAQAAGAGRGARASNAMWTALWSALAWVPVFALLAWAGECFIPWLGLPAHVAELAVDFWQPRLLGAPAAVAFGAFTAFFNGTSRTGVTLLMAALVMMVNAGLNELFIFRWGLGIAGSAWATNIAQLVGCMIGLATFVAASRQRRYVVRRVWRLRLDVFLAMWRLGFPIGLSYAGDFSAFAVFQVMQSRYSTTDGAATQIAMQLVVVSYLVGAGLAEASSIFVARAAGAGDLALARTSGNLVRTMMMWVMSATGIAVALAGTVVTPWFVTPSDPHATAIASLASRLLWIGALYQVAEAVYLGSEYALRGIGDVRATAWAVVAASIFLLMPLAHMLTFASGTGFVPVLPGAGLGATGGWLSLAVYMTVLALFTSARWRRRSRLPT